MLKNLKKNALYYRILFVAAAGIIGAAILTAISTVDILQNRFIEVYSGELRLLLRDSDYNFELLQHRVVNALDLCNGSSACEHYFSESNPDSSTVYDITRIFRKLDSEGILAAAGTNGRTFVSNDVTLRLDAREFWDLPAVQKALEHPGQIVLTLLENPPVNSRHVNMLAAVRVLKGDDSKPYLAEMLLLSQSDLGRVYRSLFDSKAVTIELVNPDGLILSSNDASLIGTASDNMEVLQDEIENPARQNYTTMGDSTYLWQNLLFFKTGLIARLHHSVFNQSVSSTSAVIAGIGAVCLLTLFAVYLIIRNSMRPIRRLIKSMSAMAEGDFEQPVPVTGKGEIRELAIAWNAMQKDLDSYVKELIELEEQKRLSELHALQMQIQPHFMYNTLASFKILLWQGKKQELIDSIDAFITLLRSTLGSREEEIPLKEEMFNLEKYAQIMSLRFGESIQFSESIQKNCEDLLIPRQILQPFVENAYFHAFNGRDSGMIFVSARKRNEKLILEISDNGSGFQEEKRKKETFSGIGIPNIQERLSLLYGSMASMSVHSSEGAGTIVRIELPAKSAVQSAESTSPQSPDETAKQPEPQ